LFFAVEDIREVVIHNNPETVKVFEEAPFKVILLAHQPWNVVLTLTTDLNIGLHTYQSHADSLRRSKWIK
jgi:hypothetical protein